VPVRAEVAYLQGEVPTAARLLAKSAALGTEWMPQIAFAQIHETVQFERMMAVVWHYRENPMFEAAWQEGEALTLEEVIDLGLALPPPAHVPYFTMLT
jgi:hypothetical protein